MEHKSNVETRFGHNVLGDIIGLARGDDLAQFRGLPFASIPQRFRQSELVSKLPQTPFDARLPGPICPQRNHGYPQYWDGPVPADFPVLPMPIQSEFDCLNLNVTAPKALLDAAAAARPGEEGEGVPVLIFFHGGGLAGGSQSIQIAGREIHDPASLVRVGIARGQPLVVITANYRVGVLGFLAGAELVADNGAAGQPVGNYGFHDQRRALEWCARFVAGFGGDPGNVTIHGSSAGAISNHYQCLFPSPTVPLFRRAILSSGSFISIGPMPVEYHQETFDAYVERVTKRSQLASTESPLSLLRSLPIAELISRAPDRVRWGPFADETWVKADAMRAWQQLPSPKPDIMVGAAEYELELFEHNFFIDGKPIPDEVVLAHAQAMIRVNGLPFELSSFPGSYPSVVAAYGLDKPLPAAFPNGEDGTKESPLTHPSRALHSWASLLADIVFRVPPLYLAMNSAGGGNVFVYAIHATNPFPRWPTSYQRANHAINEVFVFNAAPDRVPQDGGASTGYDGAVASIQRAWIQFCYGEKPWTPFNEAGDGKLGPVYVFKNGTESREYGSVEEAEGEATTKRWRAILEAAGLQ